MTTVNVRTTCDINLRPQNAPMILIPAISLIIFHVLIAVGQPLQYEPPDNIALNCGSRGSTRLPTNRTWVGDIDSKLFSFEEGQNSASVAASVVDPSSITDVDMRPYQTARFSKSEFTYKIPVTPGPKFIRLHFYSAEYQYFNSSKAFFSVKAGGYTLLNNFSVYLTADDLDRDIVVKEYCLAVKNRTVSITLAPSSSVPEAVAFINGIEVVSMPADLYYTEAAENDGLVMVGQQNSYSLTNDTAMETVYRIDVGGLIVIPPDRDTGMFRSWDTEFLYLTNQGYSLIAPEPSVHLNYKNFMSYTAPDAVYRTARTLGNVDRNLIRSYNLTWEYPVDSGFSYLLRLHFCEIVKDINKTGDRIFQIFIANQTAAREADVIAWSGGNYVPYFRDYVVSTAGGKRQNLTLALHASRDDYKSLYADAILNGLEIFKLNDFERNLAGPNPDPVPKKTQPSADQAGNGKSSNRTGVIVIVVIVVSVAIVLSIIGFIIRRGRKVKDSSSDGTAWWGPISFTTTKSTKTRGSSTLPLDLCRYFSLAEIKAATNNFDDIFVVGVGGFGNVYKGYIDNGTNPVAIKRLKSESSQGAREFKTEIEMLTHLRHRHLVSLIGYCDDHGEMILVYEYMAHGTLRDHLYKTENPPLPWKQRLEICIGAARGLHYLHKGAKHTIIHRDVKTTNILLDEKWVAKVSDFGLSKMGSTSVSKAHVTTVVKGSIGYLDPEYYRRQQLSEKSDVYSFGVVLCEVLCGRPPIMRNAEKRQVSLAEWARSCYRGGTLHQIVDPYLTGKIAPECLKKYGEIAVNCMLDNGTERPSMNDVVWGLEFALQLQQNAEDNDRVGGALVSDCGPKGEKEAVALLNNDSNGTFTCSWEDTSDVMGSSGATKISSSGQGSTTNESMKVFSEICDPKGR